MQLFRDLQRRGYAGSYGPVAAYARRLRLAQGLSPGQRRPRQSLPSVAEPVCQPLTPRRATWLVLRRGVAGHGNAVRTDVVHAWEACVGGQGLSSPRWSA